MKSCIRRSLAPLAACLLWVWAASAAAAPPDSASIQAGPPATICLADDGVPAADIPVQPPSTPAERDMTDLALAERANALSSLVETRHPGGSVSVDLQDAFWSRVVMQRNPDGSTVIRCFPAGAAVVFPLPPAKQPLEEK